MILTDSFTSSMYKQSFARVFNKDADDNLLMGFNATLEVLTTKRAESNWTNRACHLRKQEIGVCR